MSNNTTYKTYLVVMCSIHNSVYNFTRKCIRNMEFNSFRCRLGVYGKYLIDHFIGQYAWNLEYIGYPTNVMALLFQHIALCISLIFLNPVSIWMRCINARIERLVKVN
jgi:hypothetical protein